MQYWIWLRLLKGMGPIIEKKLLNHFKTPDLIYEACEDELMSVAGIGKVIAKNIISSRSLDKAHLLMEKNHRENIKLLTYNDSLYPSIAKDYDEAPTLLYYKGSIKENIEGVAVVGSRRCSEYGKRATILAAEFLASNDIPLISGMAKGIDGYAHTACLKRGGYTIAFLGNGLDICYPSEHSKLMEAISENGAVVSEYPLNTKAHSAFFPKRNALISSWSKKVLVVEAAEKSGALITADLAKSQKRELLVLPHEIYSSTGKGSNKLISEGANIYLNPSQLIINSKNILIGNKTTIETLTLESNKNNIKKLKINNNSSSIEKTIMSCIIKNAKTIEAISAEIHINQVELIEHISVMELEGKIRASIGGRYVKI